MSRLTPAIVVFSLLTAASALAQTGTGAGTNPSSTTPKDGVWPAPVGHRQPTTTDVRGSGSNQNGPSAIDAEDKALDRKLKSICKGC